MINLLERLFRRSMAKYWWQARNTGMRYGIASVQAIIHSEIKVLSKNADDNASKQRVNELLFILTQIKKVETNDYK